MPPSGPHALPGYDLRACNGPNRPAGFPTASGDPAVPGIRAPHRARASIDSLVDLDDAPALRNRETTRPRMIAGLRWQGW